MLGSVCGRGGKISYILIRILLLITLFLTSCSMGVDHKSYITGQIDLTMPIAENVAYTDEHGGFHGDGKAFGKIEFDAGNGKNFVSQIENSEEWNKMPLTENLNLIMYGGERDDVTYGYELSEKWGIPVIENGYWFFNDRHSESGDTQSDKDLLDRASFNFTVAIYDIDTNTVYYYEFDT